MKTTELPIIQSYHLPGIKHLLPGEAFQQVKQGEALLLDVREREEYSFEKIDLENVIYIPLSEFMEKFTQIPTNKTVLVICASGIRSVQVIGFLNQRGYDNLINVDGGNHAMKDAGIRYI